MPPGATGVAFSGDGNDTWLVKCSSQGSPFVVLGTVPAKQGQGLQTREAHFREFQTCQEIELSPSTGDGLFSISEVTFLAATVNRVGR